MFEKVRTLIAEQLAVDPDGITPETDIMRDLGADSIDVMELLMTLEEELEITVADDMMQNFKTVGDIVAYAEANG
jgi:acyl carrier protein